MKTEGAGREGGGAVRVVKEKRDLAGGTS